MEKEGFKTKPFPSRRPSPSKPNKCRAHLTPLLLSRATGRGRKGRLVVKQPTKSPGRGTFTPQRDRHPPPGLLAGTLCSQSPPAQLPASPDPGGAAELRSSRPRHPEGGSRQREEAPATTPPPPQRPRAPARHPASVLLPAAAGLSRREDAEEAPLAPLSPAGAPPAVPLLVPGGRGGGPREEGSEWGRGEPVIGLLTINRHDPRGGPYQLERTQERRRRAPRLPDGSAARGRAGVAGSGFRGAGRRSGPGRVTPPSAQRARAGARAAAVERARRAPVRAQRPRPGGRCAMARLRGRPARYGLPGGGFPKWLRWSSGYTWLPSALTAVELKDCWFLLPTNNAISSSGGKLLFSQ